MERLSIAELAGLMALSATPLFLDLASCMAGNLLKARRPGVGPRRVIRLAVVAPAHDEEGLIARTVMSLQASDSAAPIFVAAHNCSDDTAKAATDAGALIGVGLP